MKEMEGMSEKEISIIGQDNDYLLIADTIKGYEGRIHKSLITDNGLEIVDRKISVSGTLYEIWFQEAMVKAFEQFCELCCSHIPLFVEKHEDILQNPRFYSIIAPRSFYEGMFIGSGVITLGEMLLLWKNESVFTHECNCGGRAVVYRFVGSPLSGSCVAFCFCLQCREKSHIKSGNFNTLWRTRKNYHPLKPVSQNPVVVKDLIAILEGNLDQKLAVGTDDFHSVSGSITLRIGNKTVSNDTFSSLIWKK